MSTTEHNTKTHRGALSIAFLVLALALLVPVSAQATFTRPFLGQIAGPPAGPFGGPSAGPGGVALDGEGHLWVSDHLAAAPFQLDEFEAYPSDTFLQTLEIEGLNPPEIEHERENLITHAKEKYTEEAGLTAPASLAINHSTGSFYGIAQNTTPSANLPYVEVFDRTGAFITRWGPVGHDAQIAVDNSSEPSAGSVYVVSQEAGTISKFNASGTPVSFAASGSVSYVSGNEITGNPYGSLQNGAGVVGRVSGVAVDSHGDIYTAVAQSSNEGSSVAALEYSPSGVFLRTFDAPAFLGTAHYGGITIDPDGDVLVSEVGSGGSIEEINKGGVVEFDSEGHFLGHITETTAGHLLSEQNGSVVEIAVSSAGDLYVAEHGPAGAGIDIYGKGLFRPGLRLDEASNRLPASAVLNGAVNPEALLNPEKSGVTECRFQYVSEAAFNATGFSDLASGGEAPCSPEASKLPIEPEEFHSVHAAIDGLSSGVTYRYRLLAASGGALGGRAETAAYAFTAPHKPEVVAQSVSHLSSEFAELEATIDPLGVDTSYHFEYGRCASASTCASSPYEMSVPVPDQSIGAGGPTGSSRESVAQQVGGLAPGSAYHFRVVAASEIEGAIETSFGPDQEFTTLPAASVGLPDNRAYELVTPPDKEGAQDMFVSNSINGFFNHDDGVVSESGEQFLLETRAAFGPFAASGENAYVFSRDPAKDEWTYTSLASPSLGVQTVNQVVFDPADLSLLGFNDGVGSEASATGLSLTGLVGPPGGSYATLHADSPYTEADSTEAHAKEQTRIVGGSRDLGRVVLQSTGHMLAPGAEAQDAGTPALYEWAGGGECKLESGNCTLLNVDSEDELVSPCGAVLGNGGEEGGAHDAVAADGAKVFLTAPDPEAKNDGKGCWNGAVKNAPQLYMRSGGQTVDLSEPEAGVADPTGQHVVTYVGASEDGSRVFFVTETELTKNDEGIHDPELYEYDTETAKLSRISAGESGHADADVQNVVAVSAEGSAVYFTAFGVLARGATPLEATESPEGHENLYRYETATATTMYVATVNTGEFAGDFGNQRGLSIAPTLNLGNNVGGVYTTPTGDDLLFASSNDLTGYDTAAAPSGTCYVDSNVDSGHCYELYRFDVRAADRGEASIVCVSCDPSDAAPVGNAGFTDSAITNPASGPVRAMSDDGSYVFFETVNPLVPQATNGTLDVYEWEAPGTGGCALLKGCVHLISSGTDPRPSFFLGVSANGSNVFFGTHARLVPQDTDAAGDVYDARICTESEPCLTAPAGQTALCEGDACQSPPAAPSEATPGSLTFSGPGNVVIAPLPSAATKKATSKSRVAKCKKGLAKERGKCVKAKTKKKRVNTKKSNRRKGK